MRFEHVSNELDKKKINILRPKKYIDKNNAIYQKKKLY
jgi:hypothetical protein